MGIWTQHFCISVLKYIQQKYLLDMLLANMCHKQIRQFSICTNYLNCCLCSNITICIYIKYIRKIYIHLFTTPEVTSFKYVTGSTVHTIASYHWKIWLSHCKYSSHSKHGKWAQHFCMYLPKDNQLQKFLNMLLANMFQKQICLPNWANTSCSQTDAQREGSLAL